MSSAVSTSRPIPRLLAARLDEGLEALNLLWSGAPVTFRGAHVRIEDVVFRPVPVQQPRVPVWVGGNWPNKAPMRRAARWDGAVPNLDPGAALEALPPDPATVRALHFFLQRCREEAGNEHKPFDLVVGGMSPAGTGSTHDGAVALVQADRARTGIASSSLLVEDQGQLVECDADPILHGQVGADRVVAAAQVLHEGMSGGDGARRR
jgi:alkanesulfonate monooxygenase SsuD/methylene tetrahydromethanopterin reductase-like flavin-dependent oxidoreductase (luciferase family)